MEYPEFPDDAGYTSIRDVLSGKSGKPVKIRGWIYRTRSSGKLAFIVVRDSTGVIQCTVSRDKVTESDFDGASKALIESSVILEGEPIKDDRAPGGWEIRATSFEVFHFAETFPITKDQSDEHLLNNRHLWLRSRNMVSVLKIRSTVFKAFRATGPIWISRRYSHQVSLHQPVKAVLHFSMCHMMMRMRKADKSSMRT